MTIRPDRYRNGIVPRIYVDGASDGIAFYKRALGAVELFRMARPNGKILHAEITICGSVVMIGDPDDRLYSEPRALHRQPPHLCGRQRGLAAARGRGGCGRNPATNRHFLRRQLRQRA